MNITELKACTREIYLLSHVNALLGWDQETYMPSKAIAERGDQLALLQGLIHERITDPRVGESIEALESENLSVQDTQYLRKLKRDYDRSTKLPKDLVVRFAKAVSSSQAAWVKAREADDFDSFAPHLSEIVDLTIEKAEAIGYEDHIYDALIDEFEPGMTANQLEEVLVSQAPVLSGIVKEILDQPEPEDGFLSMPFDIQKQEQFSRHILKEIGFPLDRGRLDVTAHPFTTTLGIDDVRITTRYLERFFNSALFGTIHEAGHGFYELGFGEDIRGNLLSEGTSLGIHESQSRTWENFIGRSIAFWKRYYPKLQSMFSENLGNIDLNTFYKGINKVSMSFIRVEADEVTYNLHVILRYMLEKGIVTKAIPVQELPDAWNDTFKELFGIVPPNNREGVLQDIHWSMGAIGYFPTYAIGNLIAAQFYEVMNEELGGIDEKILEGDFYSIRQWLERNIHVFGSAKTPGELIQDISGKPLSVDPFIGYINRKYKTLYAF